MRASSILLLLCVGALVAFDGQTGAQQSEPSGAYIALGDSIAFGIGSSLPERRSYPALVHASLEAFRGADVPFTNLAEPGETAATFRTGGQYDAFAQQVETYTSAGIDVDAVTVTLGGNEILSIQDASADDREAALDEFVEAMDLALAEIRALTGPETRLVVTTYYDLSEGDPSIADSDAWWIAQFNSAISQAAELQSAGIADLHAQYRGNIDDYTYYPYDVHPKNQGYRAIARQVWSSLLFDQEPPAIEVVSGTESGRRTPTLQMNITDNVGVAAVVVTGDDGVEFRPVHRGDGAWIVLLDLRDDDAGEYRLRIQAEDSAGNSSEIEHRIVIQTD